MISIHSTTFNADRATFVIPGTLQPDNRHKHVSTASMNSDQLAIAFKSKIKIIYARTCIL